MGRGGSPTPRPPEFLNKNMTNKKEKKQKSILEKSKTFIRPIHPVQAVKKVFGLLVLLGFDVTAFTPAAYQGHRL